MREVDLDALIGSDALLVKLGGVEYVIDDIPMDVFLSYVRAIQSKESMDEVEMAWRLLKHFRPELTYDEVKSYGVRKLRSLLTLIVDHFGRTPKGLESLKDTQTG